VFVVTCTLRLYTTDHQAIKHLAMLLIGNAFAHGC
jgi:hypothetical protein